jgi:Pyruvate/2-oxoacid:ferredoxin oxidoreductase gamma subunit
MSGTTCRSPRRSASLSKKLKFYVIDAVKIAKETGMGGRTNTIMQTCFFAISGVLPKEKAIEAIKNSIVKSYMRKGQAVVDKNIAAVDATLANLYEVKVPAEGLQHSLTFCRLSPTTRRNSSRTYWAR